MPPRTLRVSTENTLFQHLDALKRNRTKRHRAGEFFVEGVKAIDRVRAHAWPIKALAYAAGRPLSSWAQGVLAAAPQAIRVALAPHLMDALSDKDDASELIAVAAIPEDTLDRIALGAGALVAVFDRPVSPGNLGSIIRSCDALAADGLIITGHGTDVYDPQTIRASMGSLFAVPVVRLPSHQPLRRWAENAAARLGRLQVVGASGEGATPVDEIDFTVPTILVFGNETRGLSAGYREMCDVLTRIPMYGTADSLNVACAASIVLYEATRQRRTKRTPLSYPQPDA